MLIVAASLAILVYGLIASTLGTILPELSSRFHLTPSDNGKIAMAQAVGLMIASVGVGPLLDYEGKKVGMILGLALIAVALFSLPRSRGFRSVVFLFFLLGVGGGIIATTGNGLASDVGEQRRAIALNLANVFFGLGGLATPLIAANLLKRNWVRLCYTVAALTVIALVLESTVRMPGPTGAQSFVFSELGSVLGNPILLLVGLTLFLYVACEVGMWNWLARHLIAQGIPESRALNILSLGFALGLLIGRAAVMPVLAHVSGLNVTLAAAVVMAVSTYLMLNSKSVKAAATLVFLAGISMGPVFPTTLSLVGDHFQKMTSTAIGFAITCGWTGLAVSSAMIGGVAGGDPRQLKRALLVIPSFAVLMVGLNFITRLLV